MTNMDFKFNIQDVIAQERTTQQNIQEIRTWIVHAKETFIPKCLPDEQIVLFLLSCVNDIELTKHTVLAYYKLRKSSPLIFDNRRMDCAEIKQILNSLSVSFVLRPKEREVIHYYRLRDTYYKNAKVEYALKVISMLLDVNQEYDPPDSISIIVDMEGYGVMHVTMLHLEALKTMFEYVQEASPIRLKGIHFINSNFILQRMLQLCRIFMKQGLIAKVHCHRGILGLTDFIPKVSLPQDYGGELPPLEELRMMTFKRFEEKQAFWEAEEKMRQQCYSK